MTEVQEMIQFIKKEKITANSICVDLKLEAGSIRISGRGIPSKHLLMVRKLLEDKYGFVLSNKAINDNVAIDNPEPAELVQRFNNNRIPKFKDGKWRFQSEDGLWLRVDNWGMKKGTTDLHKNFMPADDSIHKDKIGEFYIDVKGKKIYTKFNLK